MVHQDEGRALRGWLYAQKRCDIAAVREAADKSVAR
jgi:hypothetical protein